MVAHDLPIPRLDAPRRSPALVRFLAGQFRGRPFFVAATAVALAFLFAAVFAPWVAPYDPAYQDPNHLMSPPSALHWCGTDSFGQDLLSRVIYGTRYVFLIGFSSVAIGALGGLAIGLAAGLLQGPVEWGLMRFVDAILALPSLIMAITFISILGQGVDKVIYAVGFAMIGPFARTVRADVLQVRAQAFVEAAGLMGVSRLRIVGRHILPNVIFPLAVQATVRLSEAILVSSGLSFLGLGVVPPTPDWGLMISEGRAFISIVPWISGVPGAALALLLIALSILGDGIRERFDPKMRTNR
jgi:ABC-type dipeptide/oligopeptide/nickel transport system permease subunit